MSCRNRHHRLPKSRGGKTNRKNCCKICARRHFFWHCLFGNMTGEEIMYEVNSTMLDPRFKLTIEPIERR